MDIDNMKPEDQDLVLNAIKNGNKGLIEKFQYTDKHDMEEAECLSNLWGSITSDDGKEIDENGNYYIKSGFKFIEPASVAAGRIMEFNGANGKQNIYIKSKTYSQVGEKPRDTVWTYEVVDVDTGVPFKITIKGLKVE